MDSTTLVIPRRDSANSYKSWDDYCTQAKALAGRKAHLQLNSNSEIIEEGRLVFVSANFASFYEVKP